MEIDNVTYTMLITTDKQLISTIPCPIYQGEHNAENLEILVPNEYTGLIPTLQIILPNLKGKIKVCEYGEPYNDYWTTITVPIVSNLTESSGILKAWFSFLSEEGEEKTIKTGIGNIIISEHKGFSEVAENSGFTDITDVIESVAQLETTINTLKDTKADKIVLDSENNKLLLMSGEKEISSTALPEDVIEWEILR